MRHMRAPLPANPGRWAERIGGWTGVGVQRKDRMLLGCRDPIGFGSSGATISDVLTAIP
jgi:hypothetical protein